MSAAVNTSFESKIYLNGTLLRISYLTCVISSRHQPHRFFQMNNIFEQNFGENYSAGMLFYDVITGKSFFQLKECICMAFSWELLIWHVLFHHVITLIVSFETNNILEKNFGENYSTVVLFYDVMTHKVCFQNEWYNSRELFCGLFVYDRWFYDVTTSKLFF